MTLRVAVIGAAGRMGTAACRAIADDPDLELSARIGSGDPLEGVLDAGADVAVELTTPASVLHNTVWLIERGVHVVVGASGLGADDLQQIEGRVGPAHCMVIPNFSIGAVLMMRFAAQAAEHLAACEIVETHHPGKADAPSGTALRTAAVVADSRDRAHGHNGRGTAPPAVPGPAGAPARGEVHAGVPVHSLRLPGVVANQRVVFGGDAETLTIEHNSTDRSSFMPGLLLAVRHIPATPGLTVGLDALLGGDGR